MDKLKNKELPPTTTYDPNFMHKCSCDLCLFLRIYRGTHGGWADPRRGYSESEEDFLERVPDGFIKWPDNHRRGEEFKND